MVEKPVSWLWRFLIPALAAVMVAGCVPKIQYGSAPDQTQLSRLQPGVSTTSDVLGALGTPRGNGKLRMGNKELVREGRSEEERDIWYYEYTRMDGTQVDLKVLLVFFDGDQYDGHLWFAAAELIDVK